MATIKKYFVTEEARDNYNMSVAYANECDLEYTWYWLPWGYDDALGYWVEIEDNDPMLKEIDVIQQLLFG